MIHNKREMCQRCQRPFRVCVCDHLPEQLISTCTHVVILQAPDELKRKVCGTATLVQACLENCTVVAKKAFSTGDVEVLDKIAKEGGALIAMPGPNSIDLEAYVEQTPLENRHKTVILLDGTWRSAAKMWRRSPFLSGLVSSGKAVKFGFAAGGESKYEFRVEPRKHCLSTLECVGYALRLLEPEPQGEAVQEVLLKAFERMVALQIRFIPKFGPAASVEDADDNNGHDADTDDNNDEDEDNNNNRDDVDVDVDLLERECAKLSLAEPKGTRYLHVFVGYATNHREVLHGYVVGKPFLATGVEATEIRERVNTTIPKGKKLNIMPLQSFEALKAEKIDPVK